MFPLKKGDRSMQSPFMVKVKTGVVHHRWLLIVIQR